MPRGGNRKLPTATPRPFIVSGLCFILLMTIPFDSITVGMPSRAPTSTASPTTDTALTRVFARFACWLVSGGTGVVKELEPAAKVSGTTAADATNVEIEPTKRAEAAVSFLFEPVDTYRLNFVIVVVLYSCALAIVNKVQRPAQIASIVAQDPLRLCWYPKVGLMDRVGIHQRLKSIACIEHRSKERNYWRQKSKSSKFCDSSWFAL